VLGFDRWQLRGAERISHEGGLLHTAYQIRKIHIHKIHIHKIHIHKIHKTCTTATCGVGG
jgi:hypothetical protein